MSTLNTPEVEVIEAVALGDRARELLGGDRLLVEQHALGRDAGRPRGLHRAVDGLGVGEPELDDDVGQEAARAAAPARRSDADRRLRGSRMALGDDLGLDEAKWGFVLAHRAPAARRMTSIGAA